MHPDRKIGFAMGILLIGIVGALFFRNEPLTVDDVPRVRREKELNEHLRDRDVAVYLEDGARDSSSGTTAEPRWTLPELLKDLDARNAGVPLPVGMQGEPVVTSDQAKTEDGFHAPEDFRSVADSDFPPLFPESSQKPAVTIPTTTEPTGTEPTGTEPTGTEPPVSPPDSFPAETEFEEYVVRYGDTLSQIAEKFLGSQAKYRQIYEANKDRMKGPDHLQVGMSLRIPKQNHSDRVQ
ncbi:MAG: LysM peptidoglycan-binding domain-containing protein [Planctomyces sp.]|nr:LysM peptidoglycan-binding domain-containing protein [Planctomyces sp.]